MKKGLLLGAGFSFDLGMPLASELTDDFMYIFNRGNEKKTVATLSRQKPYSADRPINEKAIAAGINLLLEYKEKGCRNYEAAIGAIQKMEGIANATQSDRDSYNFIFVKLYELIHHILVLYQNTAYGIIYEVNKKWFSDFDSALGDGETWVFSLNHDLYVECLAADLGIPISYGDTGQISFPVDNRNLENLIEFGTSIRKDLSLESSGYIHGRQGINLIKLHGGISELHYQDRALICNLVLQDKKSPQLIHEFNRQLAMSFHVNNQKIPGGQDRWISDQKGGLEIICTSMLTGERKYSPTSKIIEGEEKLKLFDDALLAFDELTIVGYGFGDEHINFRLTNAMVLNKRLKINVVDPNRQSFANLPDCIKQFNYDGRVVRHLCDTANWMSYTKSKKWNPEQMNALKENVKYRDQIKALVRKQLS
jgi:hypothetical protein